MITANQLIAFGWRKVTDCMVADLNLTLVKHDITTPARLAHFMSQTGHESGLGLYTKELADGTAYNGRIDLGNGPDDGPRFKGAGYIQLTGRNNYQRFADYMCDPQIMSGVEYVAMKYPWSSAGFWWANAGMNKLIDDGATVELVTRKVNGGYNGLQDRTALYERWVSQNPEEDDEIMGPMKFEEDWQWKRLGDAIDGLYKKGLIEDYKWAEKAYTRKMTQTELTWLNMIVYARQSGVEV